MKELRTKIGQLHIYDLVKGAFMAAVAAPMAVLVSILDKWETTGVLVLPQTLDIHGMVKASVTIFVVYLIKQFLTGKTGKLLNNKTMNYAHQVNNYADQEQTTQDSATVYAQNNGLSVIDGEDGLPNICQIGGSQPAPLQFRDANTQQLYWTVVAPYVGTRPIGR